MSRPSFLTSRKFWAMIVGAALIVLRTYVPNFPLTDEQVTEIAVLLVAYIIGTGLQDSSQRVTVGAQVLEMQRELLALRAQAARRKP